VEYAEMLQRLAAGDLYACRRLASDGDAADHIVGFLAQQAVEKALKVALVLADLELPRTHDLELLVEQVQGTGAKVPEELSEIDWLTPWAAELRYDAPTALDRPAAVRVAGTAIAWSGGLFAGKSTTAGTSEAAG
jgi:HEPN domain-containing protein